MILEQGYGLIEDEVVTGVPIGTASGKSHKQWKWLVIIGFMIICGILIVGWYLCCKRANEKLGTLLAPTIRAMDSAPPSRIYHDADLQSEICSMMSFPITNDVLALAHRIRLYKKLAPCLESSPWKNLEPFHENLIDSLHSGLFRWTRTTYVGTLRREGALERKGIVITTGMKMLEMAIHSIRIIRDVHHSEMPIEIFYDGDKDLTEEAVKFLENLRRVRCVDINQVFDIKSLNLAGWDLKPFAMLGSLFQEVLLLDADTVLVQPPEIFFAIPEYERTGALFFRDRMMPMAKVDFPRWFNQVIPSPHSHTLKSSEIYRGITNYQQESGVVLIDKFRGIYGLLAACLLNVPGPREVIHEHLYGEKETFWIGFEIAEDPYEFYPGPEGAVGRFEGETEQGGKMTHFDTRRKILWMNDGVLENKRDPHSKLAILTHASYNGTWKMCRLINGTVHEVDSQTKKILDAIGKLWQADPLHEKPPTP